MEKIIYIEFNKVHQEIIPIFIFLSKIKNFYLDIFLIDDNLNNNLFYYIDKEIYNNFSVKSIQLLENEIINNNYKYAILGSGETPNWINKFINLNLNNKFIIRHNFINDYLTNLKNVKQIVLSEHILKLNNDLIPIYPIYFGNFDLNKRKNNYYLIQGNLEYKRRNYLSLINCCIKLKENNINENKVKFIILGRFSNQTNPEYKLKLNGDDFLDKIKKNNIEEYFEFIYGATEYKKYFEIINECKFILPLIDESYNHNYFLNKTTSSVNIGIGFKQIFVINKTFANMYNIKGITYEKDNIFSGIIESINNTAIYNNYDEIMEKNLINFSRIIDIY